MYWKKIVKRILKPYTKEQLLEIAIELIVLASEEREPLEALEMALPKEEEE